MARCLITATNVLLLQTLTQPSSLVAEAPIESILVAPRDVQIVGGEAPITLLVSHSLSDGTRVDRTAEATYRSSNESIVSVSAAGELTAVTDGSVRIIVTLDGLTAEAAVTAVHCDVVPSPDFATEIQPILAAQGCSTGACHGKQGGKNGFQLSLLGFDDDFDFDALTKEARGRRIFFSAPARSLVLRKATASEPHGGGKRFDKGHPHYAKLLHWIQAGTPRTNDSRKQLESITIEPIELLLRPEQKHRLVVTATFSDGSRRDVTALTAFSSNESVIASVDESALVTAGPIAGEAALMARFMGQIATCQVLLPRSERVEAGIYASLPRNNLIDGHVWNKLQRLNLLPSEGASDARFIRRAYLDIIGQQPSSSAVRTFLSDTAADKRDRLVNDLLDHPGYADHWANKWVDLLRPNPYRVGIKAVMSLDNWVRQSFRENKPYDQFVREIVTAQGSTWHHGATTLFRDRRSPDELTTMISQLFLGVRLECAKCHHHPFEIWGQDDFYSFAAFFARVRRKGTGLSPPISGGEEIVFVNESGSVTHPRSGETMPPRVLNGEALEIAAEVDPRGKLTDWMIDDTNPYFAKVIANRIWAELMGRGIVDPVDDLRATNPASNEELLDALATHLRANEYDLKSLIRLIATSHVYALSSRPNQTNAADYRNYSRRYRQRLRAEVLLDAVNQITESTESFAALPNGSRANEIWTHRIPSLFLDTFSRPDLNQDPPCERVSDTAVVQALHLMNSPKLHEKVTHDGGFAAKLAESKMSAREIVNELYLRVYSRYPTDEELNSRVRWIHASQSRRAATEDLLWALLNSAEFVFKD